MEFKNKTLIATGAASGMGLLASIEFVQNGGNAVMADSDEKAVFDKSKELSLLGYDVLPIVCDVRNYKQVAETCKKAYEKFGSIDYMMNFAGGASRRIFNIPSELTFAETPIEIFDWGIDVNLKGQFYFDHAVLKYMMKQKSGVIINIGSITGEEGDSKCIDYAAAKSGVMYGLTKSVALAGADYGIRCCCVSPGPVMTRKAMANMKTLLKRAAEPQEIIDLIFYLISDKASFITGVNYLIDGGRNIMRVKE